jgi:hypothetical protein
MSTAANLHVAVDLDDVTVDFFQGVIDAMYREFGVLLLKEDVTTWDDNTVKLFDWHRYGYKSWWDWMRQRDWLWATFPAIPGSVGGVAALRGRGHVVECVTSKPEWAEPQVWRWLGKWRVPFNTVHIVDLEHPKHEVSTADVLIDDKWENVKGWAMSAPDRHAILYDQPWNRHYDIVPFPRVWRAQTWEGVLDLMEKLEVDA